MRKVGPRVAVVSATLISLLGLSAGRAYSDGIVETVYVEPVSFSVPTGFVTTSRIVPTTYSYVVPTTYSYVVPTTSSFVVPTSYRTTSFTTVPTSFVSTSFMPTSFSTVPTTFTNVQDPFVLAPTTVIVPTTMRRGLLGRIFSRPVIETTRFYSASPTRFYAPTTFSIDAPVVSTGYSVACNETSIPFIPPAPVNTGSADPAAKSVQSTPKEAAEPSFDNEALPKVARPPSAAKPAVSKIKSPPEAPAVDPKLNTPTDPADGFSVPPEVEPAKPGDSQSTSMRPKATELKPRVGSSSPNMLRGEVVSGVSGGAMAGLQVVFSDPNHVFQDRSRTTDTKGGFEIFLPNGDWLIRVVDPAAKAGTKALEYGTVTSTGGRYLDSADAPIYGLRISN